MKKRKALIIMLAAIVAFLLLATGVIAITTHGTFFGLLQKANEGGDDSTVVAAVNGEAIYQSQINTERESGKLAFANLEKALAETELPQEQKDAMLNRQKALAARTDAQILDELVRKTVSLQEAKKQGFASSFEEAKLAFLSTYNWVKEQAAKPGADPDSVMAWEAIQDTMSYYHWSEEEYIEHASRVYQNNMTVSAFKSAYLEKTNQDETAYERYVDELVRTADVVYK